MFLIKTKLFMQAMLHSLFFHTIILMKINLKKSICKTAAFLTIRMTYHVDELLQPLKTPVLESSPQQTSRHPFLENNCKQCMVTAFI